MTQPFDGSKHPHGTRTRYVAGCRCDDCKASNARRWRERRTRMHDLAAEVKPSGPPIPGTFFRGGREIAVVRCPGANGAPCIVTPPTWLRSLDEAAAFLEIAPRTVRNLLSDKRLSRAGRGRRRTPLFSRAELERFRGAR